MSLDKQLLVFYLEKILSANSHTFAGTIKHLFNYLEEAVTDNKVYKKYESDREKKWKDWENSVGPHKQWSFPSEVDETQSLAYHLYKRVAEINENGAKLTYQLYLDSLDQNIYRFNEDFHDYLIQAIDNILEEDKEIAQKSQIEEKMTVKLDSLFRDLWGSDYDKLRNSIIKQKKIKSYEFTHIGITYKQDFLEINNSRYEKLGKLATEIGINIRYSVKEKLSDRLSKGYSIVVIEGLPVKWKEQYLITKEEQAPLHKLSKIQKDYIQAVFDHFQKEGEWPIIREISQKFKRKSVVEIRRSLPQSLYVDDRKYCKLTLYGIFHADRSEAYKDAIVKIAEIMKQTIESNPKQNNILINEKNDLNINIGNDNHRKEVFVMLGEPWGEGYTPLEKQLLINIPQDTSKIDSFVDSITFVKKYYGRWDESKKIDDIYIPSQIIIQPDQLVYLSFMNSKKRREIASQYIRGAELAFNNNVPLATVILYGASLECILLDVLSKRSSKVKKIKGKNVSDLNLEKMIDTAHDLGLLSKASKDLGHSLRDYRNLIHPRRCQKEKIPTYTDAQTARHVFLVIIEELSKKTKSKKP
ncbi:hypothetical protein KAW96_01550 [candidate division WOR-3 bacterium]|nr:hypothetical protein [candidate division WOR-3 bacterium]